MKAGSVIEFKYKWETSRTTNYPQWEFQTNIPTKFSELKASFSNLNAFKIISKIKQQPLLDTSFYIDPNEQYLGKVYDWALNNLHSLRYEPYMSSFDDIVQRIYFQVSSTNYHPSWLSIYSLLMSNPNFTEQFTNRLKKADDVLAQANAIADNDKKIAFLFNYVKSNITCLDESDQGFARAWNIKKGSASELNLILYHLLKQSGIKAYPVLVSSDNKIDVQYPSAWQLDKMITYVPVDSTKEYVLDVSNKYNQYNNLPYDLLNSNGFYMDVENRYFKLLDFKSNNTAKQVTNITAEISPAGKMSGKTVVSNTSYRKIDVIKEYQAYGAEKYKDKLSGKYDHLKIESVELKNMNVDSLPLIQDITFSLDLPGSDDKYIYFNANLFSEFKVNPFLSNERQSDIDFGYNAGHFIIGTFKLPTGYKVESLPKNISMVMSDKSIRFTRLLEVRDHNITLHYEINIMRTKFSNTEYPPLYDFFKRMFEMLNEQIVLKKS